MTATEFIFAIIWLFLAAGLATTVFVWSRRSRGDQGGDYGAGGYEAAYKTALAHIDALERMVLAHEKILDAYKRHLAAHDEHLRLLSNKVNEAP